MRHWINIGLKLFKKNKSIVVCGFVNPDELGNEFQIVQSRVVFILLDAKSQIIQ
jgi:hypothetical protein